MSYTLRDSTESKATGLARPDRPAIDMYLSEKGAETPLSDFHPEEPWYEDDRDGGDDITEELLEWWFLDYS